MQHRILAVAFTVILVHATAGRPHAQDSAYPAVPLLSTRTSVVSEALRYPTTGPAKVTAAIVTLAPGARTMAHRHGVPLFAYVLEGEITVDYGEQGHRTYRQGQAFMEAMAVTHFGINNGSQPMRLLAVYMGAEGADNVVPANAPQ
jgi:quercetin dioxygenase-like cupin family protein